MNNAKLNIIADYLTLLLKTFYHLYYCFIKVSHSRGQRMSKNILNQSRTLCKTLFFMLRSCIFVYYCKIVLCLF